MYICILKTFMFYLFVSVHFVIEDHTEEQTVLLKFNLMLRQTKFPIQTFKCKRKEKIICEKYIGFETQDV